ncbi:uncharacterized protein LOC130548402 isoform X2 [Triplophysa rosa]|uniref:SLAM family member 9-like n=2 Tax=Triplophysa rosa TaxID=992332 RepID=A0A9W7W8A4_TRIRA|nr:uncharacterized protein LOC130548402 isoform X2 [Triplophysa rosa]XP_057181133.1 uncharacterized protein LOC130548402 isoform X2 [Triplophysa rosa]KAI7791027.1 putative SLAM family member 9-like [Triplophysa rosa]
MKGEIYWMFGEILIAETQNEGKFARYREERADGRFTDRLKINLQTGSLTINNIRITDSGSYQVINKDSKTKLKIFNITVYARLPVPVISRDSSSSGSNCVVSCSVMNVSHVSLSWYKGKSLLSSISVSDLNIRLSLPLECLDDSYSCVVNNSITNQTQHLNTDVCHMCSDCKCTFTEAVIRLVLSALVGVTVVAVLVYDIRSRRDEQKIRSDIELNTLDSAGC